MNPPATLETPRLRLRAPVVEDAAAIFDAYTQDAQVARYTTWSPHRESVLRRWLVAPNLGPVPRDVWSFARIEETGANP